MIAGDKDHVAPPSIVRANFKKYRRSPSITEYKEFAGRSHYLCGERGWEEIADFALTWAMDRATAEENHRVSAAEPRPDELGASA